MRAQRVICSAVELSDYYSFSLEPEISEGVKSITAHLGDHTLECVREEGKSVWNGRMEKALFTSTLETTGCGLTYVAKRGVLRRDSYICESCSAEMQPGHVIVDSISWRGKNLCLCAHLVGFSHSLLDQAEFGFEVIQGKRIISTGAARRIHSDREYVLGLVDIEQLFSALSESSIKSVVLRFTMSIAIFKFLFPPINRKHMAKSAFQRFVSGYYRGTRFLAIPDENRKHDFVLRLAGEKANASDKEYARSKKNRHFANCILLEALRKGAGVAHIAADYLNKEIPFATISVSDDSAISAYCTVDGTSFTVPLRDAKGLRPITLLDEGKPLDELIHTRWVKKQHDIIFDSMVELDELCRSHDIECFLAYGSMLGAIRHHDLIPWDYDADFFMTEENYLKLRKLFDDGLAPSNRILDDWMSVDGYPGSFGRYIKTDTTQLDWKSSRGHAGIGGYGQATDIFYLLPLPNDENDRQEQIEMFLAYDELANEMHRSRGTRRKGVISKYLEYRFRCDVEGRDAVLQDLRGRLFGQVNDNASHYLSTASSTRIGESFKSEWLKPIEIEIRGHSFKCPEKYLECLRLMYGPDFRKYPSDTEFKEFDRFESSDFPYRTIEHSYLRTCPRESVIGNLRTLKHLRMQEMIWRLDTSVPYYLAEGLAFSEDLQARYKELLKQNPTPTWKELDGLFCDYYDLQLNDKHEYWPVYVEIPDDLLVLALRTLVCYRGESGTAQRILDIRKECVGNHTLLSDSISEVVSELNAMRDCYDYKDFDAAKRLAIHTIEICPEAVEAETILLLLDLGEDLDSKRIGNISNKLDNLIRDTTSALPVLALAQLKASANDITAAVMLCDYLLIGCNDGMIRMSAEKLLKELESHE